VARAGVTHPSEPVGDPKPSGARGHVNLRHWPGLGGWYSPEKPSSMVRLRDRLAFYVVALPEVGAVPERLGLGSWRQAIGAIVFGAGIFYDDSLSESDPDAITTLQAWCDSHPLDTPLGPIRRTALSLTQFNVGEFHRMAYVGRRAVVSADLGRTLGLLADWWTPAQRGEFRGGWSLGLRGWGVVAQHGDRRRWSTSYGHPKLYVQATGVHGTRAAFGWPRPNPEGKRRGVWVPAGQDRLVSYRGYFLDVIGAAFAFDAVDSSDLDDHLRMWDLSPVGAPYAVPVGTEGIESVDRLVGSIHRLALEVDREAARWG
jgi:hypothetical protein